MLSMRETFLRQHLVLQIKARPLEGLSIKRSEQYTPHQGAADYFTYHVTLNQGMFQKEFTWTDASDAKSLSEITKSVMYLAQPDAQN